MALYRYKSYDSAGKSISGVIDADSTGQASSKLKKRGLFPFELKEEAPAGEVKDRSDVRGRLRKADITTFTRQMSTLLASGMPLVESLEALSEQTESASLKKVIIAVKGRVSSGRSFSDALCMYPRFFPKVYTGLVRAGEAGGNLDSIMEGLAELGEKQEALRGKVVAALIYPLVMMLIGMAVLAVLFVAVIPRIITIFDNVGQTLPVPTRILVYSTELIRGRWPVVFAVALVLSFALYRFYGTKRGRSVIDLLLLKLPLFGPVACKVDVSRFAGSLSLLLKGGVPITDAFDIVEGVVSNVHIADSISKARDNLAEGGDITSVLKNEGLFPPMAVHMIAIGEKGGRLEEMLLNVANAFEREVERVAEGLTSILEPLLIVAMGIIVGFVALAILLPIFEMNQLVG